MTALVDLQRQMAYAIRGKDCETPIGVFRPGHLPEGEPLSVYRNHHRISLCAALSKTFPTVHLLIGEEAFHILASRFLLSQPPMQPCLSEYGAEFADYLDTEPLVKDFPYLPDITRLDWAINIAAISSDMASLDAGALGAMSPDQLAGLRLTPLPSLSLVQSRFPLPDIYQFARDGGGAGSVCLDRGGSWVMISRQHNAVRIAAIPQDAFDALQGLMNGQVLPSACEALMLTSLPEFIRKYVLAGAFSSGRVDDACFLANG